MLDNNKNSGHRGYAKIKPDSFCQFQRTKPFSDFCLIEGDCRPFPVNQWGDVAYICENCFSLAELASDQEALQAKIKEFSEKYLIPVPAPEPVKAYKPKPIRILKPKTEVKQVTEEIKENKEPEYRKHYQSVYTNDMLTWLKENAHKTPRNQLAKLFNTQFNENRSRGALEYQCYSRGIPLFCKQPKKSNKNSGRKNQTEIKTINQNNIYISENDLRDLNQSLTRAKDEIIDLDRTKLELQAIVSDLKVEVNCQKDYIKKLESEHSHYFKKLRDAEDEAMSLKKQIVDESKALVDFMRENFPFVNFFSPSSNLDRLKEISYKYNQLKVENDELCTEKYKLQSELIYKNQILKRLISSDAVEGGGVYV